MAESTLQTRMRNLAFELLNCGRAMHESTKGQFDDVNDLIFRMSSVATLLIGYAPQQLPSITPLQEARGDAATLFPDPEPERERFNIMPAAASDKIMN